MPDSPPRHRFQIHLSTAIVLMFVAGGIIWTNVYRRHVETIGLAFQTGSPSSVVCITESEFWKSPEVDSWRGDRVYGHGWPFDAAQLVKGRLLISKGTNISVNSPDEQSIIVWHTRAMWADSVIALLILFAVWSVCERLIRRRAARKEA